MTGAERLSSGPQPVMTNPACTLPLTQRCLSTHDGGAKLPSEAANAASGMEPPNASRGFSEADSPVPQGDARS